MLPLLLLIASSMYTIMNLCKWSQTSRRRLVNKRKSKKCSKILGEDRISALPDDLLVRILTFVPTKRVVSTMILSKRWRFVWTMVPRLVCREIKYAATPKRFLGGLLDFLFGKRYKKHRSVWWLLDGSLKVHNTYVLDALIIELGPLCPVNADVGECIASAVRRRVHTLVLELKWSTEPTSLPNSLYICDRLYYLCLSDKVLVDVPFTASLPSLQHLRLEFVEYKDEYSHVRLFSSCPILKYLVVQRHPKDKVTNFNIKVPSLEYLHYDSFELGVHNGALVIDSPTLKRLLINDYSEDSCSIENNPRFDKAIIFVYSYTDNKLMRSLSSVTYLALQLCVSTVECCNAISFFQLVKCTIVLQNDLDWLEPLMLLLQNSPLLKFLLIDPVISELWGDSPLSWNLPNTVPKCLSDHLEIFEWKEYGGRSEEKEAVRYIFGNSKCLKRAGIAVKSSSNMKDKMKMMEELESLSRVATSSQLLFSSQLDFQNEMAFLF